MKPIRCLAVLIAVVLAAAAVSWGAVSISVSFGPPALPVYVQPPCPAPGYVWVPGYWAWSPNSNEDSDEDSDEHSREHSHGYYWVPGTWVLPPQVGVLWTPGYWGFSVGLYYWHRDTGDQQSAFTAALTTALDTQAPAIVAANGVAATSTTIARSIT